MDLSTLSASVAVLIGFNYAVALDVVGGVIAAAVDVLIPSAKNNFAIKVLLPRKSFCQTSGTFQFSFCRTIWRLRLT